MPRSTQPGDGIVAMVSLIANRDRFVIDVGAGDGKWGSYLRGRVKKITAFEAWPAWEREACLALLYDDVLIGDARTVPEILWRKYDTVILGDVLEHLERGDALALVDRLCSCGVDVYLTVPVSPDPQNGADYGNPCESHLDQWDEGTLVRFGFDKIHAGCPFYSRVVVGTYVLNRERWETTKSEHR